MSTLHLLNTYGELLFALCDIAGNSAQDAKVIYLDDAVPLAPDIRKRITKTFPDLELIVLSEVQAEADFANLPGILPALLRRNLRWQGMGLITPRSWAPSALSGRRFTQGYIYNSGFFMAKVAAGICDRIVLRECGLNNYAPYPVGPLKGLVRLAHGLSPRRQFLGEERWIDAVEVSSPEKLPPHVGAKASRLRLDDLRGMLTHDQADQILHCFTDRLPGPKDTISKGRTAVLLTQPLDQIGFCSTAEKVSLYGELAEILRAAGFAVHIKNHPREDDFILPDTTLISKTLPIELWPFSEAGTFDVGVALCSASLAQEANFCDTAIQLVAPEVFNSGGYTCWRTELGDRLHAGLKVV